MAEKTLNHYMFLKLTEAYWTSDVGSRTGVFHSLASELRKAFASSHFYQVSPMKAEADLMIWNAIPLDGEKDENGFFDQLARETAACRGYLQPVANLWGYTRPSVYSRAPSTQEIDPFAEQRQTYLVLYPFVKTVQWYLLNKDTRQGMMNEHIRIGHQYPEIKQLLLYSFGVQDQEFIVVYETESLYRFSELVQELRGSDVRVYTERDTPIFTGIWRSAEKLAEVFGAKVGQG